MKPNVIINNIDMNKQGWLRESIDFPPVQGQTDSVSVPGRNSPIRFSEINNRISYKPRTFKIILVMSGSRRKFMEMVASASRDFAGAVSRVVISERPDVHAVGTLQLQSEYDVDKHKGTLTISCDDGDAFLFYEKETVIKQTGAGTVSLPNDFMPVVPSIQTTADATFSWSVGSDKFEKTLSAGTWTLPEFELQKGANSVTVATKGTVTFTYREGCL